MAAHEEVGGARLGDRGRVPEMSRRRWLVLETTTATGDGRGIPGILIDEVIVEVDVHHLQSLLVMAAIAAAAAALGADAVEQVSEAMVRARAASTYMDSTSLPDSSFESPL
ncbi:unnamed protein product [Urochloa humidicola]